MNTEQQLQTNLKAAKFIGSNDISVYPDSAQVSCTKTDKEFPYYEEFNIFNNAADRDAVVQALGRKQGIGIVSDWRCDGHCGWQLFGPAKIGYLKVFRAYEDAVAHAVNAVCRNMPIGEDKGERK